MMLEMNPEIRARWCTALRSGEYPKSTGRLKGPDGYCCLGVLEELRLKACGEDWVQTPAGSFAPANGASTCFLSGDTVKWAGLQDTSPFVDDDELISLNDEDRLTFAQIADRIDGKSS